MIKKSIKLKDFYEARIWEFHDITNPYEQIRLRNILGFLGLESTDVILDVGCGGGTYTKHLAKASTVIALDLSRKSIRNAKENLKQSQNIFSYYLRC